MRSKILMYGLASALLMSGLISSFLSLQANPSFVVSQSMTDYRIEVRLDHVRQVMILEMKNAPMFSRNYIEVQTMVSATSTLTVTYIPVYPDQDGYLRAELPCTSSLVDADIRLTAFAIDPAGLIYQSHFWDLERRHFNKLSDANSLYGYVDKDIREEARASIDRLNPNSSMSIRYYNTGVSHLYVSDSGLGVGPTAFLSSGTLYSASPSLGMRLSAGPAGVFTAN